jgi:hypothetical protein
MAMHIPVEYFALSEGVAYLIVLANLHSAA